MTPPQPAEPAAAFQSISDLDLAINGSLAPLTTLRIGGPADYLATPHTLTALLETIKTTHDLKLPWMILGAGSNILFADGGYRGVVISTRELKKCSLERDVLTAECGAYLSRLINEMKKKNLGGFEFTTGVPVTVGGAVTMNFGAHGGQISDLVIEALIIRPDGSTETWSKDQLKMSYRTSQVQKEPICVAQAKFKLVPTAAEEIQKRVDALNEKRWATQPRPHANAGSMFRNPEGDFAGRLIEVAGCKGMRVGGMSVSDLHANFFINDGTATAKDVQELMRQVEANVSEIFGIHLHPEIKIL